MNFGAKILGVVGHVMPYPFVVWSKEIIEKSRAHDISLVDSRILELEEREH